jgi:hypothetical protein
MKANLLLTENKRTAVAVIHLEVVMSCGWTVSLNRRLAVKRADENVSVTAVRTPLRALGHAEEVGHGESGNV